MQKSGEFCLLIKNHKKQEVFSCENFWLRRRKTGNSNSWRPSNLKRAKQYLLESHALKYFLPMTSSAHALRFSEHALVAPFGHSSLSLLSIKGEFARAKRTANTQKEAISTKSRPRRFGEHLRQSQSLLLERTNASGGKRVIVIANVSKDRLTT